MDGKFIRYFSLISLTVQNVANVLFMRYVRTRAGDMFFSSTAVVMNEVVKLFTSLILVAYEEKGMRGLLSSLKVNILQDPKDCILISIPSLIYVFQNNLLYIAVSNLDAATFQVTYQLKLLTTAVFFRIILKKYLSKIQWIALVILFIGVAMAQVKPSTPSPNTATEQNRLLGFIAVLVSSTLSGFAGIFFEKLLKGSEKSLWVRNIQLSALGIVLGIITTFISDGTRVQSKGFFYGYDWMVWIVILLQSLGGLLVAAVIMYANNILKGFATSAAIILSALFSLILFNEPISHFYYFAIVLVVTSICLYGKYPPSKTTTLPVLTNTADDKSMNK